jgi:hypothetical protein
VDLGLWIFGDVRMWSGGLIWVRVQAFQRAWALACRTPSAIILVPAEGRFSLRPSVFAGPCASNLLLQVHGRQCG